MDKIWQTVRGQLNKGSIICAYKYWHIILIRNNLCIPNRQLVTHCNVCHQCRIGVLCHNIQMKNKQIVMVYMVTQTTSFSKCIYLHPCYGGSAHMYHCALFMVHLKMYHFVLHFLPTLLKKTKRASPKALYVQYVIWNALNFKLVTFILNMSKPRPRPSPRIRGFV